MRKPECLHSGVWSSIIISLSFLIKSIRVFLPNHLKTPLKLMFVIRDYVARGWLTFARNVLQSIQDRPVCHYATF